MKGGNTVTQQNLQIVPINPNEEVTNTIFVTIDGDDFQIKLAALGLDFDASESQIMDRIVPIVEEEFNTNIRDLYKVRKAINSQNIYIIPSSTAGW